MLDEPADCFLLVSIGDAVFPKVRYLSFFDDSGGGYSLVGLIPMSVVDEDDGVEKNRLLKFPMLIPGDRSGVVVPRKEEVEA